MRFLDAIERNDVAAAVELYRGDFLTVRVGPKRSSIAGLNPKRVRLRLVQIALRPVRSCAYRGPVVGSGCSHVQGGCRLLPRSTKAPRYSKQMSLFAAGRSREALMSLRRFTEVLQAQLDLPPSARVRELPTR